MVFARETIESCIEEAKPLLEAHYAEIAHYHDIPLDPDYDQYLQLEKMGIVRCYVARNSEGKMVGYAVYIVRNNLHYKTSLQAVQDIIFVKKECRGSERSRRNELQGEALLPRYRTLSSLAQTPSGIVLIVA